MKQKLCRCTKKRIVPGKKNNYKTSNAIIILYGRGNLIEYPIKIYGNILFK